MRSSPRIAGVAPPSEAPPMSTAPAANARLVPASMFGCAALMIAYQVASRAVRDALFLSSFEASRLPLMVAGASVVAIATALLTTRAMTRYGPERVVRVGFGVSAVLTVGEWALALREPALAAVVVYLHVAALGPTLVSGFWSILHERFDPRSARRAVGRVAGIGTLGGLAGGVLSERLSAWTGVPSTLAALALIHAG